jgi:malate dehydrogenase (decarboxylating)
MPATGMVKQGGLTPEAAASHFWVLDAQGLVTQYRPGLPSYVSAFARPTSCSVGDEGDGLLEVVRKVKPTVLLGLAGEAPVGEKPVNDKI